MIKISNGLCVVLEQEDTVAMLFFQGDEGYEEICSLLKPFITFAQTWNRLPEITGEMLPVIINGLEELDYDEDNLVNTAKDFFNLFFNFYIVHERYPQTLKELVELLKEYSESSFAYDITVSYL